MRQFITFVFFVCGLLALASPFIMVFFTSPADYRYMMNEGGGFGTWIAHLLTLPIYWINIVMAVAVFIFGPKIAAYVESCLKSSDNTVDEVKEELRKLRKGDE